MPEPSNPRREINFQNNAEDLFKIHMLGYHDFRFVDSWKFFRVSPWYAIHYVRNGRGKLFIKGKEYSAAAGDFFIIEKNEAIMYYADENDPWRYYWIDFHGDACFKVNEKLGLNADFPVCHAEHPDKITEIFDELFSVNLTTTSLYYSVLSALMQIVSLEHNKGSVLKNQSSFDSLAENAKKIIELNYTSFDFSVQDIAKMLYVSERHIRRVFSEKMGMPPVSYISEVRLNAAIRLLQKRDFTVEELCSAIGWRNKSYFMNCFKKKYNMTVKEYKNKLKL